MVTQERLRLSLTLLQCLSLKGEGDEILERGFAPLKHPGIINPEQGESKRGEAPLIYPFPLPLIKGKGDKGGWGCQINLKGWGHL